jgi:hypothetical protein
MYMTQQRVSQQRDRSLIWRFYGDLKAYRTNPTPGRRGQLRARFDRIFARRTGFVTLDPLLARLCGEFRTQADDAGQQGYAASGGAAPWSPTLCLLPL